MTRDFSPFDYINPDITEKNFPIQKRPHGAFVVKHYGKDMSTKDVLKDMEKEKLLPAMLDELLEYGKSEWNENEEDNVIALGSSWMNRYGEPCVPYLHMLFDERSVGLILVRDGWYGSCRFLAVRKVSLGHSVTQHLKDFDPSAKKQIKALQQENARLKKQLTKIQGIVGI